MIPAPGPVLGSVPTLEAPSVPAATWEKMWLVMPMRMVAGLMCSTTRAKPLVDGILHRIGQPLFFLLPCYRVAGAWRTGELPYEVDATGESWST